MTKAAPALSVNDRVVHAVYGDGTISSTNADYTTIDFDGAGTRKFVTRMLNVEPSEVAAPAKPPKKRATKKATATAKAPAKAKAKAAK